MNTMNIEEIHKQITTHYDHHELCTRNLFSIIKAFYSTVKPVDVVRTWAFYPQSIAKLYSITPIDIAKHYFWDIRETCKSTMFRIFLGKLDNVDKIPYNLTIKMYGELLNVTIVEMAFYTRMSLAVLYSLKMDFKTLQMKVEQGKLIEIKVARIVELVAFIEYLQPGIQYNVLSLSNFVSNCSYEVARNLTDKSMKKLIAKYNIDIFIKFIHLKNIAKFFGILSFAEFQELQISNVILDLLGMKLFQIQSSFPRMNILNIAEKKIHDIERYWNLSSQLLTIENILLVGKLMKGNERLLNRA